MLKPQILHVGLGARSYPITVGYGLDLDGELQELASMYSKLIVITDEHLRQTYREAFADYTVFTVGAGEASKTFEQFAALAEQILALGIDRKTCLLAFGGGVVGDLTGFLASTLLRGIDFIQCPTSLLAMVDSSVGGKTGVNTKAGKNLVGTFYQPKHVLIDLAWLDSLPEREWRAGYAEIIKYGLIVDADFFDMLEQHGADLADRTKQDEVTQKRRLDAVEKSCRIKADIVQSDETEKSGLRALLNFGHTFGHALENHYGYDGRLNHGEAVAIGMVMAARFSAKSGFLDGGAVERIVAHFKKAGLPCTLADRGLTPPTAKQVLQEMQKDKKTVSGKITLILLNRIGQAIVANNVELSVLEAFLNEELK